MTRQNNMLGMSAGTYSLFATTRSTNILFACNHITVNSVSERHFFFRIFSSSLFTYAVQSAETWLKIADHFDDRTLLVAGCNKSANLPK
jgi:hypothetical protein